jgi:hypothetical protein
MAKQNLIGESEATLRPMLAQELPPLACPVPAGGFGADCFLITSKGTKVKRWGSVRQACKILGGCDRESVYVLIAAGLLDAYKLQPHRPNSHWRVDLVGCQLHKIGQLAGSAKAG